MKNNTVVRLKSLTRLSPTPKADTGELTPEEMKMYEKDFNQ